jgi:hypothetical protein
MIVKAGSSAQTLSVFTLKFATVKGFTGVSGLVAGSVFVMLAFVGFEAAAPLAEEAREPRRTVPRAVIGSCVLVGIFYLVLRQRQLGSDSLDPHLARDGADVGSHRKWRFPIRSDAYLALAPLRRESAGAAARTPLPVQWER